MDATLDGFDWDALDRRFVPRSLRGAGVMPLHMNREPALRSALSARPSSEGDGLESGLADRLAALIAWARVDVPVAVLAAGHAHAEDLLGGSASRYLRPDALWTVWLSEAAVLRASVGGPVYRLDGVVSRPLGGGITTHAVVVAEAPEGAMLFAADVRHPRIHVMADVAAAAGSPVEYSGAFRFEGVPATPLPRPMPPRDRIGRYLRLSSTVLVIGAAAGLAEELAALPAVSGQAGRDTRRTVDRLAVRALTTARAIDGAGPGRSLPWIDAEISELAADAREVAADLLTWGGRVDGHPGGAAARRSEQLELALRLETRAT